MTLHLQAWDWIFLVWFLAVSLGVGIWYTKRAGASLSEYFLSGRDLPWWALGTSMIATSLASDTPLVVAGFVLSQGIAKNWLWWNFLLGGTLTVFVFSRWWRRSRVVTEIELIARRYDGAPARVLRGFKAVYLGLLLNSIVFGWVTKAMDRVMRTVLPSGTSSTVSIGILVVITLVYTALSGLWGAVATDVLQFAVAMVGAFLVAALGVAQAGGLSGMLARVREIETQTGRDFLSLTPSPGDALFGIVLVLVLVNWWAVYYPGAEPGGGGYVAQRMLAAQDEKQARAGTLWYIVVHYALRPWPWILTGLAALVLEPRFAGIVAPGAAPPDPEQFAPEAAFPWMFRYLPVGMLGLVIASFFAAYMSTITSLLNLSASYLVNDFWIPFVERPRDGRGEVPVKRDAAAERAQVLVARVAVVVVTLAGCGVTWLLSSAGEGWTVVMEYTAGSGLVLLARWLWWRVNAWSEISAMAASALFSMVLRSGPGELFLARVAQSSLATELRLGPRDLLLPCVVLATTIVWLGVTLATRPTAPDHLARFFRDVRPGGWWSPVARATGLAPASLKRDVVLWLASTAAAYGALFGVGNALLLHPARAAICGIVALAGGIAVWWTLRGEPERPTAG